MTKRRRVPETIPITIRLTVATVRRVEAIVAEQGAYSRSDIIRTAVEEYVRRVDREAA